MSSPNNDEIKAAVVVPPEEGVIDKPPPASLGESRKQILSKPTIIVIGVILVIAIITLSVVVSQSGDEEEGLDNSFCSQFGITDSAARRILNNPEVDFEVRYEGIFRLRCIPENALSQRVLDFIFEEGALTFKKCPIKAIHPKAFPNLELSAVKRLTIEETDLVDLPANVFERFDSLELLFMTGNHFIKLEEDIFGTEVTSLVQVRFNDCESLEELPQFVERQKSLEVVRFTDTQISELEDGFFEDFEEFRTLDVQQTPLAKKSASEVELSGIDTFEHTGVEGESFCGFNVFEDEDRRFDIRGIVRNGIFAADQSLVLQDTFQRICLPIDSFREIEDEARELMQSFTDGEIIIVQDGEADINPLAFIDSELFNGFTSLILDIEEVGPFLRFQDDHFAPLANLTNLEIVNLKRPNQIEVELMGDRCLLETFSITNSDLHQPPSFLAGCESLRIADFSNNPKLLFLNPDAFSGLQNLERIDLTGTPLSDFFNVADLAASIGVEEDVIIVNS